MKHVTWVILVAAVCFFIGYGCKTCDESCDTPGETTDIVGHPKFEEMCSKCHKFDRVDAVHQHLSKDEMKTLMERMSKKPGSGIEQNDIDVILEEIY